jgi:hypothetical protein
MKGGYRATTVDSTVDWVRYPVVSANSLVSRLSRSVANTPAICRDSRSGHHGLQAGGHRCFAGSARSMSPRYAARRRSRSAPLMEGPGNRAFLASLLYSPIPASTVDSADFHETVTALLWFHTTLQTDDRFESRIVARKAVSQMPGIVTFLAHDQCLS